ncbi:hypothetical protein [Gimesia maris]|tara:strand:- start:4281 stop:4409 length:129 start_codon:yes stop_codon:yes gene_type:complete
MTCSAVPPDFKIVTNREEKRMGLNGIRAERSEQEVAGPMSKA